MDMGDAGVGNHGNAGCGQISAQMTQDTTDAAGSVGATAVDPVCGMTVTLNPATRHETFGAQTFHFCSGKCQAKFSADPWFYTNGKVRTKGHDAAGVAQYTCPMHPQILQDTPGNCPI